MDEPMAVQMAVLWVVLKVAQMDVLMVASWVDLRAEKRAPLKAETKVE